MGLFWIYALICELTSSLQRELKRPLELKGERVKFAFLVQALVL